MTDGDDVEMFALEWDGDEGVRSLVECTYIQFPAKKSVDYFRYIFLGRVIDRLTIDHPVRSFCFTMDNLNTHKNPMVLNLIPGEGHRYLFRAPYWSVNGPIEYIFNTIHTHRLSFFTQIHDLDQLENCKIIGDMGSFERYFFRVGFHDT